MQGTLTPNRALLENWRGAASSRGAARPDNRCQPHLGRASRGRHRRYTLLPSSPMGKFRNLSPGEVSAQKSALSSLPARPAQPSPQRRRTQDAPNPRTHVPGPGRPFPGVAQNSARHAGTKWGGGGGGRASLEHAQCVLGAGGRIPAADVATQASDPPWGGGRRLHPPCWMPQIRHNLSGSFPKKIKKIKSQVSSGGPAFSLGAGGSPGGARGFFFSPPPPPRGRCHGDAGGR